MNEGGARNSLKLIRLKRQAGGEKSEFSIPS